MSRLTDRQLARKLRPISTPEPPPGLLDELRRQIPDEIKAPAVPDEPGSGGLLPFRRPLPRRLWLAAASVAMVLGAGTLSYVALRNGVGIGAVEPREPLITAKPESPEAPAHPSDYVTEETSGASRSPAETRASSAGAMQRRERPALGYAGAAPPSSATSPAPAYPGRFGVEGKESGSRLAPPAAAGSLYVELYDNTGTALPGVTVTAERPGQAPTVAVTDAHGNAKLGALPAGEYRLKAELEGFATVVHDQVAVTQRRNTVVEAQLTSSVEDVVSVAAESPLVDERRRTDNDTVSREELEKIPVLRDPWKIVRATPGALGGKVSPEEQGAAKARAAERDQPASAMRATAAAEPAPAARATTAPEPAEPTPAPTRPPVADDDTEPNEQSSAEIVFEGYRVNPFVDADDDRLSTFALDVGSGSFDVVRGYLDLGQLPPREAVRVAELVNAFDYRDAPPSSGDFALTAEGAADPWAPGSRYVLVRFAVRARESVTRTPQTVAEEARAQVQVDPRFVSRWRFVGYENRAVLDERFRDETLDAGEIGAGHTATALYELELRPDVPGDATLALLRLRWRPAGTASQGAAAFREIERPLRKRELAASWESASRGFRLATLVARFAEVLRGAYWAQQGPPAGDDFGELERRAAEASEAWPREARVHELAKLVGRARDLQRAAVRARAQQ